MKWNGIMLMTSLPRPSSNLHGTGNKALCNGGLIEKPGYLGVRQSVKKLANHLAQYHNLQKKESIRSGKKGPPKYIPQPKKIIIFPNLYTNIILTLYIVVLQPCTSKVQTLPTQPTLQTIPNPRVIVRYPYF